MHTHTNTHLRAVLTREGLSWASNGMLGALVWRCALRSSQIVPYLTRTTIVVSRMAFYLTRTSFYLTRVGKVFHDEA